MRERLPDDTYCHHCNVWIAPYAEHIRYWGHCFHEGCFTLWHKAQLEKQRERLDERKKERS